MTVVPPPPAPPPSIAQLVVKYCAVATPSDAPPGETAPLPRTAAKMGNNTLTHNINGSAHFAAVNAEINYILANQPQTSYFYMTAWWLGLADVRQTKATVLQAGGASSYSLNLDAPPLILPNANNATLLARLQQLHQAGVEVRVLPWITRFITLKKVATDTPAGPVNLHSLLSVAQLRTQLAPHVAALNMLAHTLGAVHCKIIVCGNANRMVAFVSGLDPVHNRLVAPFYQQSQNVDKLGRPIFDGGWHDAGVRIEGTAAAGVYDFFRSLWNEQLQRPVETFSVSGNAIPSHNKGWPTVPQRPPVALPANTGRQYVQVLRTVPQMNFGQASKVRRGQLLKPDSNVIWQQIVGDAAQYAGFAAKPISFAPQGIFEFKVALFAAIRAAERYIFIADQSMFAFEVMDEIARRIKVRPNLKVILLLGPDPADPLNAFAPEAVNNHLLAPHVNPNNIAYYRWHANTVHCKVTIIDDTWCAIGSANNMRRSLFTDIELAVCVVEPPTPNASLPANWVEEANPGGFGKIAPSFVQRFRRDLWAYYFGVDLNPLSNADKTLKTKMLSLDAMLHQWQAHWASGGATIAPRRQLRAGIREVDVTKFPPTLEIKKKGGGFVEMPLVFDQLDYDINDGDSRQPF